MEAFKEAYDRNIRRFILETDHGESYWLWRNSLEHGAPAQFEEIVRQLNTKKRDPNFKYEVRLCDPEDNQLAAYLAEQGAARWNQIVIVRRFFGRIFEIWHSDMGPGSVDPRIDAVREEDLEAKAAEEDVFNPGLNENEEEEDSESQAGAGGGPVDMEWG